MPDTSEATADLTQLPPFEERVATIRGQSADLDGPIAGQRFLVIGGTGFVGRYLVEEVLARGAAEARILCRTPPADDPERDPRVAFHTGSVTDAAIVSEACRDIDAVLLTAASYGSPAFGRTGKGEGVYAVNVGGVKNVIAACRERGVSKLVYTGSTNVVFDGKHRTDIDETLAYANPRKVDHYSRSKIRAEQLVVAAHGPELGTCVLRPNGIYGPREAFITGKVLGIVKKLRGLPFSLYPKQRTDWTFVYNLVQATLLCLDGLDERPDEVGGKAYFITDGQPLHTMRDFTGRFLKGLGIKYRPWIRVPRALMIYGCAMTEWLLHGLRWLVKINPPFTKAEALKSVTTHTHSCERANRLLGYTPLFSTDEGIEYMNRELRVRWADTFPAPDDAKG